MAWTSWCSVSPSPSSSRATTPSWSTRVLVLHEGVVARELLGEGLTEHQLVHAMEGVESEAAS